MFGIRQFNRQIKNTEKECIIYVGKNDFDNL